MKNNYYLPEDVRRKYNAMAWFAVRVYGEFDMPLFNPQTGKYIIFKNAHRLQDANGWRVQLIDEELPEWLKEEIEER